MAALKNPAAEANSYRAKPVMNRSVCMTFNSVLRDISMSQSG
jgi:hypothetical protein